MSQSCQSANLAVPGVSSNLIFSCKLSIKQNPLSFFLIWAHGGKAGPTHGTPQVLDEKVSLRDAGGALRPNREKEGDATVDVNGALSPLIVPS